MKLKILIFIIKKHIFIFMCRYEIVKVDHDGLWSDFIYLGMTDNVQ